MQGSWVPVVQAICAFLGLLGTYRAVRGTQGSKRLYAAIPFVFYAVGPASSGAMRVDPTAGTWVAWIPLAWMAATGISGAAFIYCFPDPPANPFLAKLLNR